MQKLHEFLKSHNIDPDMIGVLIWIGIFFVLFIVFGNGWFSMGSFQWVR